MSRKDQESAHLPQSDNPGRNSQLANAVRAQSSVDPSEYPADKRRAAKELAGRKAASGADPDA